MKKLILLSLSLFFYLNLQAQPGWTVGDFHQHTTFTDGSYSIFHMMRPKMRSLVWTGGQTANMAEHLK
jgi:hypothetical protein